MLSIRQADERLQTLKDSAARKAHTLGRISLYLESIPELPSTQHLEVLKKQLTSEISIIEGLVCAEAIQDKLESILSLIGNEMTRWAQELLLEHSERPLRFNHKKLKLNFE